MLLFYQINPTEQPFLKILLQNLELLTQLNLDCALVVLGILLKLAQIPLSGLHAYLMHSQATEPYTCVVGLLGQVRTFP